jgi:hypothetical protein
MRGRRLGSYVEEQWHQVRAVSLVLVTVGEHDAAIRRS